MLIICFAVGLVFIPIGVVCLSASSGVVEYTVRYDDKPGCLPGDVAVGDTHAASQALSAIEDGAGVSCSVMIQVDKDMKAPVFLYYEMDNFFQNHRRYVKSRSDLQMLSSNSFSELGECTPPLDRDEDGHAIYPCGLVAWSFFNDTYALTKTVGDATSAVDVLETGIAWASDVKDKFDNEPLDEEHLVNGDLPFVNNQNPDARGGGVLDPTKSLSEDEHFVVWMRTAALPHFRKLWGRIESDIPAGTTITVDVENRYNTYAFKGKKSVVLSTASWLGGKNAFLGVAYIAVGAASLLFGLVFLVVRHIKPRKLGDPSLLSWNQ